MKKSEVIYHGLVELYNDERGCEGVSADALSDHIGIHRSNVSRYLNQLHEEQKVEKIQGRPVLFRPISVEKPIPAHKGTTENIFERLIGAKESLHVQIQQSKAAVLYPPNGLHTLLLGETGVGKSMFAELMYRFSMESKVLETEAPFIIFNCADYADNPQLLLGQLFGVKKGAYTGADRDRDGILKKADGGILFLDEIHRLSSAGQEMLFTYIDKGFFRRLGDTDEVVHANTFIIAATTENPQSYLLKTFTRRIPMVITLPSLKDRSMGERLYLVEEFLRQESKRIGRSIYVNRNCILSLVLYDCPNNIGQLKSDIQLTCAKAFLNYKSQKKDYILVTASDLPQNVKMGMMRIKEKRNELEGLIHVKGEILRYCYDEKKDIFQQQDSGEFSSNFYDAIEQQIASLRERGLQEHEINEIVNIDIESHFKKFMGSIFRKTKKDEIRKVVDGEVLDLTETILAFAADRLNKDFEEKICYGLALHLNATIQRLKNGNKIYNPRLNMIRLHYPDEFLTAMEAAKIIESKLSVELPLDEIGYITLFFSTDHLENDYLDEIGRTGVLVIMHGASTASSMAEVANRLVGTDHVEAMDMPLDMPAEQFYHQVKEKVSSMDKGKGVLMMVDMGSLANFGDMVYEDTGIKVMTVEMVSTLMVLEACRKAVMNRSIQEIYEACIDINLYLRKKAQVEEKVKKNIIVTACFTGEGAAEGLKEILYKKLDLDEDLEIIALDLINRRAFMEQLQWISEEKKILAVVGTIDINTPDIPFITAKDVLVGSGIEKLQQIIDTETVYYKIATSLKYHLKTVDSHKVILTVKTIIEQIQKELGIELTKDVLVGMLLHICFMIEKTKRGEPLAQYKNKQQIFAKYSREFDVIQQNMKEIEGQFDIQIGVDEICYITETIVKNHHKCV
ncbi:MAG: sigma 54-interacting transcriptional regulator [Bacillota bacterium]